MDPPKIIFVNLIFANQNPTILYCIPYNVDFHESDKTAKTEEVIGLKSFQKYSIVLLKLFDVIHVY